MHVCTSVSITFWSRVYFPVGNFVVGNTICDLSIWNSKSVICPKQNKRKKIKGLCYFVVYVECLTASPQSNLTASAINTRQINCTSGLSSPTPSPVEFDTAKALAIQVVSVSGMAL